VIGRERMIYFKACPKCRGDMLPERDSSGEYRHCLQCGMLEDMVPAPARIVALASNRRAA
jgi:DNA-directed RNA polymerase subunit M/transcription elongation factor TFIIS